MKGNADIGLFTKPSKMDGSSMKIQSPQQTTLRDTALEEFILESDSMRSILKVVH